MPVYLLTAHAYRSSREDHPKGYVQRREGLKEPTPRLAAWRANHADFPPIRFDQEMQKLLHEVTIEIATEKKVRLHAGATTPTHVHALVSFQSPACTCGAPSQHCHQTCPAKKRADATMTRMKQKMGQQLAQLRQTSGRPYFSRGWDTQPVKNQRHFDHLTTEYLPDHETTQAGIYRLYP
jgi:REP element-mobilizing transposase RayT